MISLDPSDGMALTNGSTYTISTVYLPVNADISQWWDVPIGEYFAWKVRQEQGIPENQVITYSKLGLINALEKRGLWPAVKAIIQAGGYEDKWNACQVLRSGNDAFETGKKLIMQALQQQGVAITESDLTQILVESVNQD